MEGLSLHMAIYPFCDRFGLATVPVKVQDLLNYASIDPMVQRKLSTSQLRKISSYLQERELDRIFFGPVTLSLRDVSALAKAEGMLLLRPGTKLSILDGQHRILALRYVNEQLAKEVRRYTKKLSMLKVKGRKEPDNSEIAEEVEQVEGLLRQLEQRRLELMESELTVQIYIGLEEMEEKQLFGDINSKVQLVSKELGHAFDSVDPINTLIQQVANNHVLLRAAGVENRSSLTSFNKNFTCFSWLYSMATILFTGKMQASYEFVRKVRQQQAVHLELLHQFFSAVLPMLPEKPGATTYITSSRTVQESLALFAHRCLVAEDGSYNKDWLSRIKALEGMDWTHQNEMLAELYGTLDNGKLNLIHEKSLRKHEKLVRWLEQKAV